MGVVIANRNLARQRYQKWTSPLAFGSKNPTDLCQLAPLGVGVSKMYYERLLDRYILGYYKIHI
ncbi:hypothetical protein CN327_24875 [Bacillus cereus]|nr:hypothetical protein CN327_24875 [Bacillus cereus]